MFEFAPTRRARTPSLTPMIDVVFLLLVFFMLAARFGQDFALPLTTQGTRTPYEGPPRLIDIGSEELRLNGVETNAEVLIAQLEPLMRSQADVVILRPDQTAPMQRLVDVIDVLNAAGLTQVVIVEARP